MDLIIPSLLYVALLVCVWLAHRLVRKVDAARIAHLEDVNLRHTLRVNEIVMENTQLHKVNDQLLDLARMLEGANYHLGCLVYGQEAVDRMLAQLKKNARN
jgi:hypothetical protein